MRQIVSGGMALEEKALIDMWFAGADEGTRQALADRAKTVTVRKNQLLLEAGEVQNYVCFLVRGVFRGFLVEADGRDITDCFAARPGDLVMGCNALGAPSQVGLEAMVDSEVLMIPVTVVEPMLQGSLELLRMYNRYLVSALEYHWETKMLLYRCTAMERYRWFLSRYPGLIDSISNKHIASFLGMTPVTLSRLRRQLRSQADGGEEAPGEAAKTE